MNLEKRVKKLERSVLMLGVLCVILALGILVTQIFYKQAMQNLIEIDEELFSVIDEIIDLDENIVDNMVLMVQIDSNVATALENMLDRIEVLEGRR